MAKTGLSRLLKTGFQVAVKSCWDNLQMNEYICTLRARVFPFAVGVKPDASNTSAVLQEDGMAWQIFNEQQQLIMLKPVASSVT